MPGCILGVMSINQTLAAEAAPKRPETVTCSTVEGRARSFGPKDRIFGRKFRSFGAKERSFGRKERSFGAKIRSFRAKFRSFGRKLRIFHPKFRSFAPKFRCFGPKDRSFSSTRGGGLSRRPLEERSRAPPGAMASHALSVHHIEERKEGRIVTWQTLLLLQHSTPRAPKR